MIQLKMYLFNFLKYLGILLYVILVFKSFLKLFHSIIIISIFNIIWFFVTLS